MNEPAFPNPRWEGWGDPQAGMSLRDYFAAKAMQAIISDKEMIASLGSHESIATASYKVADAMMEARK